MDSRKIKSALISVFDKDGLEPILRLLADNGVSLISTGGTHAFIESLGFECAKAESLTGFPSIFGGRVKTLHPAIMGGILQRREMEEDRSEAEKYSIPEIDLVIVDLYPFEKTVATTDCEQDIIEKIDIGGISLIRAAAKNFKDVVIVASKAQYPLLQDILAVSGAETTLAQRQNFARLAFGVSSAYDSAIFNWFDRSEPQALRLAVDGHKSLRYGENPHQKAAFFGDFEQMFSQLHGKEISYNNLLDIDAAVKLVTEFDGADYEGQKAFCVLKHNNACGAAVRPTVLQAWTDALACDPVSAFGGVLITNGEIDEATAAEINKIFFEVIIAPAYTEKALEILKSKKNRIILEARSLQLPAMRYRSALNGVLAQEDDCVTTPAETTDACARKATPEEIADLKFANAIVKCSKSNAIVLAKNGCLLASGVGQTSRIDALRQAIEKAKSFGFDLNGAVMASDAFFPFSDCVQTAHEAGITAVIHPGGSIRDAESVEYCDNNGMAMLVTGVRHFRH